MKALVGAFNQEKALVGAFSVIVQPVVEPMEHYTALLCGGGSLILDDDITFFLHLIENCSFIRLIDHTKLYSNSQPQSRKIEEDNFSLITFFSSEHPCKKQPPFTRPSYNTGGDTK